MANETAQRDFWNSLWNSLRCGRSRLATLIRAGNRRQLVLRNAEGVTLLRLPLTLAVIVGLFLLWQAAPLLLVAFILALALRVQFLIVELEQQAADLPEAQ